MKDDFYNHNTIEIQNVTFFQPLRRQKIHFEELAAFKILHCNGLIKSFSEIIIKN